jgi:glycosyltransferase involved in cell wall biosynthesis
LRQDSKLSIEVLQSDVKSSAKQRNHAAAFATGDIVAFLDDDIEFEPGLFEEVLTHFASTSVREMGALSPRIANQGRNRPGRLTMAYYRLQAGYPGTDYGGCLFGPGINCFPLFDDNDEEKIQVQWLPATCLFLRHSIFKEERFPEFDGYSFAEDVHLTARISQKGSLFFLKKLSILHHSLPSEFKKDQAELTAGKLHNMAIVAREVQGLSGWRLRFKWQLHRFFMLAVLAIRRPPAWFDQIKGVLRAKL